MAEWQAPRRCEYSGRLYCHECHRGDVAVLPAAVLHGWDFNPRPVSAMAADYLASIAHQPLLCIGAVNPGAGLPPAHAQTILPMQVSHASFGQHSCSVQSTVWQLQDRCESGQMLLGM